MSRTKARMRETSVNPLMVARALRRFMLVVSYPLETPRIIPPA
jgi:hypothetical protein